MPISFSLISLGRNASPRKPSEARCLKLRSTVRKTHWKDPKSHQDARQGNADPAHDSTLKNDRGIERYKEHEQVERIARPRSLRPSHPQSKNVGQPDDTESVVEIETATPIHSEQLLGVATGRVVSRRMTPVVVEMERADHVRRERDEAQRPRPANERARSIDIPLRYANDKRNGVEGECRMDGQSCREFAEIHVFSPPLLRHTECAYYPLAHTSPFGNSCASSDSGRIVML